MRFSYIGQYILSRKILMNELGMKPEDVAVMTDTQVSETISKEFFGFCELTDEGDCDQEMVMLIRRKDFDKIKKLYLKR